MTKILFGTYIYLYISFIYMLESVFGFDQSSDFFQLSTKSNKNTLWDPTKYIYLESARRDLQNDEI